MRVNRIVGNTILFVHVQYYYTKQEVARTSIHVLREREGDLGSLHHFLEKYELDGH